jgi:hypothetical protein
MNFSKAKMVLAAFVVAAVAGNVMAGLKAPVTVNAKLAKGTGKKTVLIYYANETCGSKRFEEVSKLLVKVDGKLATKFEKRVSEDMNAFQAAVKSDITALKHHALTSSENGLSVVIFTTQDAHNGRFTSIVNGTVRTHELTLPKFDDAVYEIYPLSDPRVFESALRSVNELYSAKTHQFVLITKSHGSRKYAMTGLTSKLKFSSVADLKAHASAQKKQDGLDVFQGLDAFQGLDEWDGLSIVDGLSSIKAKFGTTKKEYAAILKRVGMQTGMQFPVVFLESCKSELTTETVKTLSKNVGHVHTSDEDGLKYQTLDYSKVLSGSNGNLANAIHTVLQKASSK